MTLKRGRSKALVGVAALAVAALAATGLNVFTAHAQAPGDAVAQTEAVFNDPTGSQDEQYAVRDHVMGLVESTEAGETISMSLYNITDDERVFADALLDAADRGVQVRVVLESENAATGSAQAIVDGLGTDREQPSWAVVCSSGCHGTNINHNKFYLFSEVGGESEVTVQSSANLTISNSTGMWNNAVTFVDNSALYQGYMDYFDDLARDAVDSSYYTTISAGDVKGYHFPRAGGDEQTDTVYNTLENVDCAAGDEPAVIRVGMWYFGRAPVAQRLADLGAAGCEVDIVYTEMLDAPFELLDGADNVTMTQLPEGGDIIHSKYYLIDGHYADSEQKVVFTGSPNFSDRALRVNDETMLRIYSDDIHDQYAANFADMRDS